MSLIQLSNALDPPQGYPGKLNPKNQSGTSMSKTEWINKEANEWFSKIVENPVYDETWFANKVRALNKWLSKRFKMCTSEAKKILTDIEFNYSENQKVPTHADNDTMEVDESERDMFELSDDENQAEKGNQVDQNSSDEAEEGTIDMDINDESSLGRHEREKIVLQYKSKPIEELLETEKYLPKFVTRCLWFKHRKNEYIDEKFDEEYTLQCSQELLMRQSQLPALITESERYRKRLAHLNNAEKSNKRMLKNARETIRLLKKSNTTAAKEHIKIITAALYDSRYGCPDLDVSHTVQKSAKTTKAALLSGVKNDLKPEKRKKYKLFHDAVEDLAEDCWRTRATRPDPSKHHRPNKTQKDQSGETVPTIWQTMTNEEAYQVFKENYGDAVRQKMEEKCREERAELLKWKESVTKEKRMSAVDRKETMFPGLIWFVAQKPSETKLMGKFPFMYSSNLCLFLFS